MNENETSSSDQQSPQVGTQFTFSLTPYYASQHPSAYDAYGRPLYQVPAQVSTPSPQQVTAANADSVSRESQVSTRPDSYAGHNFDPKIRAQYANEPDYSHTKRAYEPKVSQISPELKARHDASVKKYPFLNLSPGEYVIMAVQRHPFGLFTPIVITVFMMFLSLMGIIMYPVLMEGDDNLLNLYPTVVFILILMMVLIALGGYIAVWVYMKNMFFLTNESIIQEIQTTLFAHREQTVSLGSIEDASYRRSGIIQSLFDFGTIRLSTEGEETTYRFHYVSTPKDQVAILHNAIEDFKNGRPVRDID